MIAVGSIGQSIARGDDPAAHEMVLLQASKYVTKSASGLSESDMPVNVLFYVIWMFWQLDLVRGYLKSSPVHIESAMRIAAQADPIEVDQEELTGLFAMESVYWGLDPGICPVAFDPRNDAHVRKRYATGVLQRTCGDLSDFIVEISTKTNVVPASARPRVLKTLQRCRQDAEFLLLKWSSDLAERAIKMGEQLPPFNDDLDPRASLKPRYDRQLQAAASSNFDDRALTKFEARAVALVPQMLVVCAQDDFDMRRDQVKLMELGLIDD
jgi:hypothetical protein